MDKFVCLLVLNLALVHGQPIFGPLAAQLAAAPMAVPLDTFGAATAFSGGIGIPLLSPLELNAIIEAQSGTPFKSAFTEGDAEVSGFSGAFPASFDEGFANDKDTEFYESPQHGEPPIPKDENVDAGPSEKPRDTRGAYHRDEEAGGRGGEGPPEPREPEEKRFVEREPEGRYQDEGPSAYRSRGKNGQYDREASDPNGPPPEHYASGAVQDGPDGPSEGRENGASAYGRSRDEDFLGPGPDREPENRARESYRSERDEDDSRRPERDEERFNDDGFEPRGRNSESRPSAYRPGHPPANPFFVGMRESVRDAPSSGDGFGNRNTAFGHHGQSFQRPMSRPVSPDYSGYKVITG